MDTPDTPIRPDAQPDTNDLRKQYLDLRKQVFNILILLIIVSGTFSGFLLYQYRQVNRELKAFRPQALPVIEEYNKNLRPRWEEIEKRITEYGRTHPDFGPIMAKFRLMGTNVQTTLPSTSPTPATLPPAPAAAPK
jgi:hypothetical protein